MFKKLRDTRPAAGPPVADRPAGGRPAAGRPAAGRPAAGRPAAGRPVAGQSAAGRPAAVENVPEPACNHTGGEQRWSKISTTTAWSNHLGHLWCCDFDDDGSPNDQVYPTAKHQG